jgi:hypothetical protein
MENERLGGALTEKVSELSLETKPSETEFSP